MPPGLTCPKHVHSAHTNICRPFFTEGPTPSHILPIHRGPVSDCPQKSIQLHAFSPRSQHRRLSGERGQKLYSLFLNGLVYYSIAKPVLSSGPHNFFRRSLSGSSTSQQEKVSFTIVPMLSMTRCARSNSSHNNKSRASFRERGRASHHCPPPAAALKRFPIISQRVIFRCDHIALGRPDRFFALPGLR